MNPSITVARRLRKSVDSDAATSPMDTVVCGNCGQRYGIRRDPSAHDPELVKKQSAWVQQQLVWDHIQERRHRGTIELPKLV